MILLEIKMTEQEIVRKIPHDFREKIIIEWLPVARPSMGNEEFKMLWEAYFIYVDCDAIRKPDCHVCLNNVLNNWRHLAEVIAEVEREYNLIEAL